MMSMSKNPQILRSHNRLTIDEGMSKKRAVGERVQFIRFMIKAVGKGELDQCCGISPLKAPINELKPATKIK